MIFFPLAILKLRTNIQVLAKHFKKLSECLFSRPFVSIVCKSANSLSQFAACVILPIFVYSHHFLGVMNSLGYSLLHQTPHGIFHLCVSHCVNNRVEHGCEDCKEHSQPLVHRVRGHRTRVGEHTRTKKSTATAKWAPHVESALRRPSEPRDSRSSGRLCRRRAAGKK